MAQDAVGVTGGIYACRAIQGTDYLSLHAEGRAVDWVLDNRDARQRRIADGIVAAWLKRRHGQDHALARRMGLQEIIWNCRIWRSDRPSDGLAEYPPCSSSTDRTVRHENHLHVGLNHDGAEQRTSYWTQGPWPQDLLAVDRGGRRPAVRVLDGGTGYASFLRRRPVRLGETPNQTSGFLYGDYDHDGIDDLFVIESRGQGRRARVVVYAGAGNFSSKLLTTTTALTTTSARRVSFGLGDLDHDGRLDLYAIKHGGLRSPVVHVLNGADRYRSFLYSVRAPLPMTASSFHFAVGDGNNDGIDDIYAIRHRKGATRVHVLDGAANFRSLQGLVTTTRLRGSARGARFLVGDANDDGVEDIYRISSPGGSNTVRVVSLAGPTFTAFNLRVNTALQVSGHSRWGFALPAQRGL
jgi:hypothetical protein